MLNMNNIIIITGVAGFIGYSLADKLLNKRYSIIGIDAMFGSGENLRLKQRRLEILQEYKAFKFVNVDLSLMNNNLIDVFSPADVVIHLAASPGVRQSMKTPEPYMQNNIHAFANVIDLCHCARIGKFIYASSSSVYGDVITNGAIIPLTEDMDTNHPQSVYSMTKKSNELLAYVYSSAFGIKTIGLRLFSVYGPFGRIDMAPWIFAQSILENKVITLYDEGKMIRDFTYIDDVTSAITAVLEQDIDKNYSIYNVGSSNPHSVITLLHTIEHKLGIKANYISSKALEGDVKYTCASTDLIRKTYTLPPATNLSEGISLFCKWIKEYLF